MKELTKEQKAKLGLIGIWVIFVLGMLVGWALTSTTL